MMKPIAAHTVKMRFRKSSSGRIGSVARRSANTNADEQDDAEHDQHRDLRRPPRERRATEAREEHDRREAAGEQRRAEIVDLVLDARRARVEDRADHDHRHRGDRQVDVEDPAPREVVDEEAAEERADDRRDAEDRTEDALVTAAVARRDDVADDGDRRRDQAARAEPLDRPERDQLGHVLRDPAEHRADEEDDDRDLERLLAPVEVAELAVERAGDRRGEQVRGHDPGEVLEPAEVADDRRQRGRDDRLVERREEDHEHERAEDQADARSGLGGRAHSLSGTSRGGSPARCNASGSA